MHHFINVSPEKNEKVNPHCLNHIRFLLFTFLCCVLSVCLFHSIVKLNLQEHNINEMSIFDQMRDIRLKNPKKITMGHLNINSIPNKFVGIMDLVKTNLDIFFISETEIDSSFPKNKFHSEGGVLKTL